MSKATYGRRNSRISFEDWRARILRDRNLFPEIQTFPDIRVPLAPFFVSNSNQTQSDIKKDALNGQARFHEAPTCDDAA
tara:strand:+ start:84913 stop:85149 length:237 start_codon:yes stop_codon:yes gene_type:complete